MALSESVGSALSAIHTNLSKNDVKGMEINANHLKSVKKGKVIARAHFLHKGKNSHIVQINVRNEMGKLVSVCRLTNMIIKK